MISQIRPKNYRKIVILLEISKSGASSHLRNTLRICLTNNDIWFEAFMRDRKPFFNLFSEVSVENDGSVKINCWTFTENDENWSSGLQNFVNTFLLIKVSVTIS